MEIAKYSKYRFISFTDKGKELMASLAAKLKDQADPKSVGEEILYESECDAKAFVKENFSSGNVLVFVSAVAISVRLIAPFIKDKTKDPAVIVLDEKGEFVIPILSGHIGGGVLEARKLAGLIGATPVITTATDVREAFAVDVFAKQNDLQISDMTLAKEYSAKLLNNGQAHYYVDEKYINEISVTTIPLEESKEGNTVLISPETIIQGRFQLMPKCIVIGIGCKKGTESDRLKRFVDRCLEEEGLFTGAIKAIVSIDIKKDERALLDLAAEYGVPFETFTKEELMAQKGDFDSSEFVRQVTGADNVCERAVIAYGCSRLVIRKRAEDGITFAAGIIRISL